MADSRQLTADRSQDAQQRARLLRILHAEGAKRGLDHQALTEGAALGYQVTSLAGLTLPQLRDYIQRLGTRRRSPVCSGTRARTPRPSGKSRPEGVVWLPTVKQRRFMTDLLGQLFAGHPDPLDAALKFVRSKIGADLPADALIADVAAIADAVTTGKSAGILINSLVGEMKRRGMWR